MIAGGLDRLRIGVESLETTVAFFRDTLGMEVAAECGLDRATLAPYGVPPETTLRTACLKFPIQSTLIELLQVEPRRGRFVRDRNRHGDYGLYDVAFIVRDLEAMVADCRAQGFEMLSDPVTYTADWLNITVKEAIVLGPSRARLALAEILSEPKPAFAGRVGGMVDVATVVPSIEAATPFLTQAMGYQKRMDRDLTGGVVNVALALPREAAVRIAAFQQPDTPTAALELIQCSTPGESLAELASPLNLGMFALGFRTQNLEGTVTAIQAAGGELLAAPVEVEIAVHGRVRQAVVRAPYGPLLELYAG